MVTILVVVLIALAVVNGCMLAVLLRRRTTKIDLTREFQAIEDHLGRVDQAVREELGRNREEAGRTARDGREELANRLHQFEDRFAANVKAFNEVQHQKFTDLVVRLDTLVKSTDAKMEGIRETLGNRLSAIQEDNTKKLEQMRATVDEKLHATLEERLGQSFKLVSERLELVQKGLGEMQSLASGVGDLKRVLSNVKTRGILGEIQLAAILDQILSREQYDVNVVTKRRGRENVEFAIRLPGKDQEREVVWLPVDSKFPLETYRALLEAYDRGDAVKVEEAGKLLESTMRKCARDIRDKYVDPPATTEFAIMFLPVEGLYAEVVRRPGLFDTLQREYRVTITGPSTLAALLNSLQMGFRTLAIEKRSGEVWRVLSAVKTEFEKFGGVLHKAQERLGQVSSDLDTLVGVRTRQIQRRLRTIQDPSTAPTVSTADNLRLLEAGEEDGGDVDEPVAG